MVQTLPTKSHDALRAYLQGRGYSFETRPHQVFLAKGRGAVVNLYLNGKVVLGGSDNDERSEVARFIETLGGSPPAPVTQSSGADLSSISGTRVGVDEAGKGDYFGPLVACAVLATEEQMARCRDLGVRDSKALESSAIHDIADALRSHILPRGQWRVVTIPPRRYNVLIEKMGNLNSVLGWAHARAIEEVLRSPEPVSLVIADQFGDQKYVADNLFERGRSVRLLQTPKGERDIAVAAASILARDEFLAELASLSKKFGVEFPRGATHVIDFARNLVNRHGEAVLLETAKVHFATTSSVIPSTSSLMRMIRDQATLEVGRGRTRSE